MKRIAFLVASFLGILTYVVLSLVGGRDGILSEKQLRQQKQIISIHTSEIQKVNDELTLEYTALLKDPDVIAAYAKKLGYVGENEKLVKITGLPAAPVTLYNTGSVLKRESIFYLSESVCKATAFVVFVITLVIFILIDLGKQMEKSAPVTKIVKGIPVYDLSQA